MSEDDDSTEAFPVVDASLYGVFGYLGGYLTTLLLVVGAESDGFPGDLIEISGWVYYNAQFVDIVTRGVPNNGSGTPSVNYVTGTGLSRSAFETLTVPSILYHLIPIVAFVLAGFALVQDVGASSAREGAKVGAGLVFGCLFLSIVGTFIFEIGGRVALGPSRPTSLLFVGILYPAICGAVGGAIGSVLD
jgi:hypothetical protein